MQSKIKNVIYYWLPLSAYCVFIYIQSSNPSMQQLPSFEFSDKLMHFGAYAILGVLFYRAYHTLPHEAIMRWIMPLSIISASLYGVSDEIHQSFVPYRDGSFADVIADILGAVCGGYLYHRWNRRNTELGWQSTDVSEQRTDDR